MTARLWRRILASLLLCLLGLNSGFAAEQPAPSQPVVNTLPSTTVTAPADPESSDTTKAQVTPLEQTIETFITSEEIDTDKAVDFPTNI